MIRPDALGDGSSPGSKGYPAPEPSLTHLALTTSPGSSSAPAMRMMVRPPALLRAGRLIVESSADCALDCSNRSLASDLVQATFARARICLLDRRLDRVAIREVSRDSCPLLANARSIAAWRRGSAGGMETHFRLLKPLTSLRAERNNHAVAQQLNLRLEIVARAGSPRAATDSSALSGRRAQIGLSDPCATKLVSERQLGPAGSQNAAKIAVDGVTFGVEMMKGRGGHLLDRLDRRAGSIVLRCVGVSGFGDDQDKLDLIETAECSHEAAGHIPAIWRPRSNVAACTGEMHTWTECRLQELKEFWARERATRGHLKRGPVTSRQARPDRLGSW